MHIFIECETFDDLGGWVVETQSREAMGLSGSLPTASGIR
jgi:hypothetical protein